MVVPRHWIVASIIVLAVAAGVTVFAVTSGDDDSTTVASESSTTTRPTSATTGTTTTLPTTSAPSSPSSGTTTSVATSTSTVVSTTTTVPCPPPTGTTDPADTGLGADVALLTDVAVAPVDRCSDRVTFTFRPEAGPPGVRAAYEDPPFAEAGSGNPISVRGSAFLVVRFEPASVFDFNTAELSYTGPDSVLGLDTSWVREARLTGSFEGLVDWVIGLDEIRPFRVGVVAGEAVITFS